MDENELRLDYWIDTRSDKTFPLWIIFKQIGQAQGKFDNLAYLRQSGLDIVSVLKTLEQHPRIGDMARDLEIGEQELRAMLWFLVWLVEKNAPPASWESWNERIDEAWRNKTLT